MSWTPDLDAIRADVAESRAKWGDYRLADGTPSVVVRLRRHCEAFLAAAGEGTMGAYSQGLGPRKRGPRRARARDGAELPLFDQRPHRDEPDGIERPKPLPGQASFLEPEGVPDGDG